MDRGQVTLFRSSRPDYIETYQSSRKLSRAESELFRSSRPDYIETWQPSSSWGAASVDCSGLPDRTTLRRGRFLPIPYRLSPNCSGLPDRTTLRPISTQLWLVSWTTHCSGLPDRTTLRHGLHELLRTPSTKLFRSSRPDYIETTGPVPMASSSR